MLGTCCHQRVKLWTGPPKYALPPVDGTVRTDPAGLIGGIDPTPKDPVGIDEYAGGIGPKGSDPGMSFPLPYRLPDGMEPGGE
mmetsp:Transcript_123948/g.214866  ORF Transcript_123948/g.214866 Transcript_123948/m.214866 type:complete len:83 (+) Transcript_123948:49-297(+)